MIFALSISTLSISSANAQTGAPPRGLSLRVGVGQDRAAHPAARRPPMKSISTVQLDLRPVEGALPEDFGAMYFERQGALPGLVRPEQRRDTVVTWHAPAMYHFPLYFEEINLERYGYGRGHLQPALSGAHFFGRIPALPYMLTARHCREKMYVLGHALPGSPFPRMCYFPRFRTKAAAAEAATAVGLVFLIP